jgi:hypothetical protein
MLSHSTNSSPGVWTELVAVYSPETGRSYIATVAELHFRGLLGTGRPAPRGEHSKGKLIVSRRKWRCWRHVRCAFCRWCWTCLLYGPAVWACADGLQLHTHFSCAFVAACRLIATILYACGATCSRGCWMW